MLTDEQIASEECRCLTAHAQFIGSGDVWIEGANDFARAIEAAATEPLLERIAALEAKLAQRVPDGRLHDDGYFTWNSKRHPNGQRPVQLPTDFWLSAAPAAPEQQEPTRPSDFVVRPDGNGGTGIFYEPVAQAPNAQQAEPHGRPVSERAAELAADPVRGPRIAALRERLKKQAESQDPCSLCGVKGFHACAVAQALNAQQEPVAVIRTWHKQGEIDQHAELIDWFDALENSPDGEHMLFTHPQPAQLQALSDGKILELIEKYWNDPTITANVFAQKVQSALAAKNGVVLK